MKNVLLALCFLFPALGAASEYIVAAESINYQPEAGIVTASGDIEIAGTDGRVWADRIEYDVTKGKLAVAGNVVFQSSMGVTLYLEELELSGDLATAGFASLQARLPSATPEQSGPAIIASSGARATSDTLVLRDVVYSPCPKCDGDTSRLPWKIKAKKVTYHTERQQVSYKHATFEAWDAPIMYLPYFRHSVGKPRGISGILPPRFGQSGNRGTEMELAAYFHHSPNRDTTIRSRLMSERGILLRPEHRWQGVQSAGDIRSGFVNDEQTGEFRSFFNGEAEYRFSPGRRVGFNAELASDDTVLDDFLDESPNFLPATVYAENAGNQHYATVYGRYYHELREGQDPALTAQVLPRIQLDRWWQVPRTGGQLRASADFLSIYRDLGAQPRRAVGQLNYIRPWLAETGDRFTLDARLRGDYYQIDRNSTNDDSAARVLPQLTLGWERPLVAPSGEHEIIPQLQIITAPAGGNPNDIPNIDSVGYELDYTNLFASNRFAGYDRIEPGSRVVYGLGQLWRTPEGQRWLEVFVGQSYRFIEDSSLPATGGTSTKGSDWVGEITYTPRKNISLNNSFRLDNSDLAARRYDTSLLIGNILKSHLQVTHSFLDNGPEEVQAKFRYDFNPIWSVRGEFRRDLTGSDKQLLSEGELVYTHPCYRVGFLVRRRGFENRSSPPATDFLLNFQLLTLGEGYTDD